ncbi:MAG: hypothetical protein I3274_07300 [Candidatus Moeniiplasma glomeromycotorum]|nr:hypothetical protein [Candidatus Moeniiplasma glomeromycotorum]
MLCSNCYKKISKGEEVQQSGSITWRAGWAGGGYGSEVLCKRCSIKVRKRNFRFVIFFIILTIAIIIISVGLTIYFKNK